MDNLDYSENNAMISDSAYSNSRSNSQSRRSHSSKSTHSGSNSSGSSGYGGKPSSGLGQPPEKRSKDAKKKKQVLADTLINEVKVEAEGTTTEQVTSDGAKEEVNDVVLTSSPMHMQPEKGVEDMEICTTDRNSNHDEVLPCNTALVNVSNNSITNPQPLTSNGFSCVISMHDGVVIYTTTSLTTCLGFPKQMWVGRSFIDFIHPRDRNNFASQITSGLPEIVNGTQEKVPSVSTMVCRLRRYRGLSTGFSVVDRALVYLPFLLKLSFRNISDEEGRVIYLVIQATQLGSAFKISNESISNAVPFIIRHSANGNLDYIDPESVPYLGYMPQEITDKDVTLLYHPEDLGYLRQVYETIVKEGGIPCSKPYRLMAQNGDYVKVETEWSSFINPWSKKLQFVVGKHHVIGGPMNPDVFQSPNQENASNQNAEQKNELKCFRENIIRIMNEILTRPAELAKQHMSKRCQDLATFMESLIEEQPRPEEELRLEIQEPENSFCIRESISLPSRHQVLAMVFQERDSVMLGGISPHHEYNDSKSSSETPLSYNQLNYKENMQRYFNSHKPYSYEDYNTATGENILDWKDSNTAPKTCLSPLAQHSANSGEMISSCESSTLVDLSPKPSPVEAARLTESMLNKHNAEMEKELVKLHRGNRSCCKSDAEKMLMKTMRNKQEHLARCNTAYQPTTVGMIPLIEHKLHGLKRACEQADTEASGQKHHCSSSKQMRCNQLTSAASMTPLSTLTTNVAWPCQPSNMNTYLVGVGIPQELPVVSPVAAVPVQYVMYGQAMYGSPLMYSPVAQMQYPLQENLLAQTLQFSNSFNHYMSSTNNHRNETVTTDTLPSSDNKTKRTRTGLGNSEDRTDEESSYSSFYSSFFKTDSGSAEESGGNTTKCGQQDPNTYPKEDCTEPHAKKRAMMARRKTEPPWMEQVCVTSELVYKYQVLPKSWDEVLTEDKKRMHSLEQPSMVNEQLGQLYLDLQLEGVASRLTLEEGITSSGSSVDESTSKSPVKISRRKREYSKLVLIYEDEMPLPTPEDPVEPVEPSPSTSNT